MSYGMLPRDKSTKRNGHCCFKASFNWSHEPMFIMVMFADESSPFFSSMPHLLWILNYSSFIYSKRISIISILEPYLYPHPSRKFRNFNERKYSRNLDGSMDKRAASNLLKGQCLLYSVFLNISNERTNAVYP